jgi:hypothetical protein
LVSRARDIKKRLEWRMDNWLKNQYLMLVQDTENTLERMLTKKQGMTTAEQGALRGAVRCITDRKMGGFLLPDDECSNTGLPVSDVLNSKHPMARAQDVNALPHYEDLPEEFINHLLGPKGPVRLAIPSTGGKVVHLGVVAPPW